MAKKVVFTPAPDLTDDLDMASIGEYIRHQRTKSGITLVDAAALSNLSKQTYQNIEKGHSKVKVASLLKACRAFGVRLRIVPLQTTDDCI